MKIKCTNIFRQRNIYGLKFFYMKILNSRYEIHEAAVRLLALLEMSIRSYFQPENGLPHPKGSLSCSLPSPAIALANKEVEKVIGRTKKRGVQRTEYRSTICMLWDPSHTAKPLQDKDSVNMMATNARFPMQLFHETLHTYNFVL